MGSLPYTSGRDIRAAIGQQTSEITWLNHAASTDGEAAKPHEYSD